MPKNFFLNSLRENREKTETKSTSTEESEGAVKRECHNSKKINTSHGDATAFCQECAEFYCKTCADYHKAFGVSREHHMRPAAEVDMSIVHQSQMLHRMQHCAQHPRQELDIYCDTCLVPVCTKCCLLGHKQHMYRELSTVAEDCQKQLLDMVQAATEHMTKLQEQHGKLETSQNNIQRDVTKVRKELHLKADEIRDVVTKREECLMKELDESEERALASVRAACKETELNMASTQSLVSYMQALQVSGDVLDQVVHTPGLQKQLKQQQGTPTCEVLWDAKINRESGNVDVLGTVDMKSESAKCDVGMGKIEPDEALSTLKPDVGGWVVGLVVHGDIVCVTGFSKPYLWVHNTVTKEHKRHEVRGLQAAGMTALKNEGNAGTFTVVISHLKEMLLFVTVDQSSLEITKQFANDIDFTPGRVTTNCETEKLVVADYKKKQIVCHDDNRKISVQGIAENMTCAAATFGGYVIVDNAADGRVHWVDAQGRITHTYGQQDSESLRNPVHITGDSQGRLLVVDKDNHRLHLVGANGQLFCYLLTQDDGIQTPTCVCLDENSPRLYVAHGNHPNCQVRVYKWPCGTSSALTKLTLNVHFGADWRQG